MTLPVVYRPEIKSDLDSAYDWYEQHQDGLGEALLTSVSNAISQITAAPRRHSCVRGAVRALTTHRFPYVIYYVVQPHRVLILGVLHAKRDPSVWMQRSSSE
jgi:plasmid stabilization system protein ParE